MSIHIKRFLRLLKNVLIILLLLISLVFIIYDFILTKNLKEISEADDDLYKNKIFCNDLQIHMVDVDQGDGFVITNKDKVIVVDTGPMLNPSAMKNYLKNLGVKRINILILTHPHQDHFGGLAKILCNFKVDMIYTTEISKNTNMSLVERFHLKKCEYILEKFNSYNNNSKIETFKNNDETLKILTIDDIKITFLAPLKSYKDINNNSLVFKLEYKNISALFTGDIEKEAESDLVKFYGDKLKVDILKLAHHGSESSNSEIFLQKTNPEIALISCKYANSLSHPHMAVAKLLEKMKISVYRTDENGSVVLTTDGYEINSNTEKGDYKYGAQLKP